jgi:hypothetical protein
MKFRRRRTLDPDMRGKASTRLREGETAWASGRRRPSYFAGRSQDEWRAAQERRIEAHARRVERELLRMGFPTH